MRSTFVPTPKERFLFIKERFQLSIYKHGEEVECGTRKLKNTLVNVSPFQRLLIYLPGRALLKACVEIIGRPTVHEEPSFLWAPREPLKR